jgi:Domain of unknown function (DUF4020)/SIR2-like domain
VLFVGAGVSFAPPSNLPDFRTLAADIAADGNISVTEAALAQPDVLLGELEDHHHVDAHVRVAARIGVQSSQPNRLHKAIVALAAASPQLRIVTTNYDLHLSKVLAAQDLSVTEYMAPALPMGDDFTGLVYLHGCLRQDPGALVVTDADFGRGYLRDAWATRFLERMFATYTVLFVGYSHDDVVMSYLARGLRLAKGRFVLTSKPDRSNWRRLRIQPVGYPRVESSHDALVDAVAGWASWASMGLLGHRKRVAELVSGAPSEVPEEASYLEAVLADSEKVEFFTEHARGTEWLSWAAGQPEFQQLFDPAVAPTGRSGRLAYWFAEHYVMDERLTESALSAVQEAGGRLAPAVWSAIGHHLHLLQDPRPAWLGPWIVLLVQNAPEQTHQWLDYALTASRWPEDRVAALLMFDFLTEPQAVFRPSYGVAGAPRFDVHLRGHAHWLREAWERLFAPNVAEAAPDVLVIVDRQLRRAHQLLTAAGTIQPSWAFRRSAIEAHSQDSLRWPVDVLIDAARDCLEALLESADDLGAAYLHAWAATDVPLLQRLSVYGWTLRRDVDANAKLRWLRDRGWLFNHRLRHEVFRLIETALADADTDVADALVADAVAGPSHTEDRDYVSFNALAWMARHAPGLQSARQALERVQAEHPEFEERPHPDLTVSWSESGTVGPQPPMTAENLHQLIEANAGGAVAELLRHEYARSPVDNPNWNGALTVLAEVVGDWPGDGFAVLDADGGDHPDIIRAVIRGWAAATLDDVTPSSIMERLARMDLSAVADDIARLLFEGGRSEATPTEWQRISASRDLAAAVWAAVPGGMPDPEVDDWLGRAINHPAGRLAQFWVRAVAGDWRDAGERWSGLSSGTRDQLEVLLTGDDERTALAEVIFASHLHFFFAADLDWCEDRVLPLLDWVEPVRARRSWDGFLLWGRWNDQMLAAGLLTQYLAGAKHIEEFTDELRRQLSLHLAGVAVSSEVDPITTGWVRTFTTSVDTEVRTEWMHQVGWLLREMPAEAVEHQWERWMRRYWQDRLVSVPIQLTLEEAAAMACWVIYLTSSVADGVALATAYPARLLQRSDLLHDLTDERVARAPAAVAALLAHLLRGNQQPFYDCYFLRDVVRRLREQPTPADVTAILGQAVRLGCGDAPTW